jgi:hypothetical protein
LQVTTKEQKLLSLFKIRDPYGLIAQDPELKKKVDFHNDVFVPIFLGVCATAMLIIAGAIVVLALING